MRVLILGAGGIFGQRVARELSRDPAFFVIAGGRREPPPANEWQASVTIDSRALDFAAQLRAQAVVDYLVNQWEFDRTRFVVTGSGPDKPLCNEANPAAEGMTLEECRAMNRTTRAAVLQR